MKDRKIYDESNVWSTAQRQTKIYRFDVHAGLEGNHRSVSYGKQCLAAWSCIEEDGHISRRALDFRLKVKGRRGGQRGREKGRLRKKV